MKAAFSKGGRASRHLGGAAAAAAGLLAVAGAASAAPWTPQTQRSPVAAEAASPRVAINANGDAVAVWTALLGTRRQVQAAFKPAAGEWGAAETVSLTGTGDAYLPQVAIDSAGNAHAVWTRTARGGGLVVQAAKRPAGAIGWDPPQDVSGTQRQAASVGVSVNADGQAAAVWTGRVGNRMRIQLARREPADAGWSAGFSVSGSGQNALEPAVAVDPAGTAALVWRRYDGKVYRVQSTLCPQGAACIPAQSLSQPGRSATNPRVGIDSAGNVHVLWRRFDGVRYRVQAAARGASGVFTPAVTVSAFPSAQPTLAVSPGGDVVAAWRTYGRGERVQASVRVPATGQWATPTDLTVPGNTIRVRDPRIAIGTDGDAVVIWEIPALSGDRIETAVRAPGATVFTPAERVAVGGDLSDPALAVDGAGLARAFFVRFVTGGRAVVSTERPAG